MLRLSQVFSLSSTRPYLVREWHRTVEVVATLRCPKRKPPRLFHKFVVVTVLTKRLEFLGLIVVVVGSQAGKAAVIVFAVLER